MRRLDKTVMLPAMASEEAAIGGKRNAQQKTQRGHVQNREEKHARECAPVEASKASFEKEQAVVRT